MNVIGIETSCDETAVAVVAGRKILSSCIASQEAIHAPYGGVVPELASRRHLEMVAPLLNGALKKADMRLQDVDGVAATCAPGLLPALLIGLSFGKAFAFALGKPFIGVNHLEGHLNSVFLEDPDLQYPFLAMVVSGGHTSVYDVKDFGQYQLIGATRDDAAGEAYDKVAKLMGLGYPGGPLIDRLAAEGNRRAFGLTIRKLKNDSLDFSFSGIKTAVMLLVRQQGQPLSQQFIKDCAASFQETVISILAGRLKTVAKRLDHSRVIVAGGVAANKGLRKKLEELSKETGLKISIPGIALCTDNAAMIAYVGGEYLKRGKTSAWDLNAVAQQELGLS